jgi:hypothetical protein
MSKIFIYNIGDYGPQELVNLDLAKRYVDNGDDVTIVTCDRTVGLCVYNKLGSELYCKLCEMSQKSRIHGLLGNKVKHLSITVDDSYEINFLDELKSCKTLADIKRINYKSVEIGYAAVSTYVTLTGIVNPVMDDEFINYISLLLCSQSRVVNRLEELLAICSPDCILVYNGRLAQFKPMLGLAQKSGINFICSESFVDARGCVHVQRFQNSTPHSIHSNYQRMIENWDKEFASMGDSVTIKAESFFLKRRIAQFSGDKVYTAHQLKGNLPDGFNENIYNVVIFPSSEDEFVAISSDFDNGNIFENQLAALEAIFERHKQDEGIVFYVKCHPNMARLSGTSYYQQMASLNYRNVVFIEPMSNVDSYAMLDKCDLVIVFNSTIGIEAAYWGRPVISLRKNFYQNFNVVLQPRNRDEFWAMLDSRDVKNCWNSDGLKYALYMLRDESNPILIRKAEYKRIFLKGGLSLRYFSGYRFFGSAILYTLCTKLVRLLAEKGVSKTLVESIPNKD